MIYLKPVILILLVTVLPFMAGLNMVPFLNKKNDKWYTVYILGFMLDMAAFFVTAIACMLLVKQVPFNTCSFAYLIIQSVLAVTGLAGAIYRRKNSGKSGSSKKKNSNEVNDTFRSSFLESAFLWVAFAVIVAFTLIKSMTTVFDDGDNAYYVTQAVLADEQGAMYTLLPYTGGPTQLDLRHALAVMPMWFAYLARISGIPAGIVCRSIGPLFLIPVSLLAWLMVGRAIYGDTRVIDGRVTEDAGRLPFFMCMVSVIYLYGSTSRYTAERFIMTRSWQGKAMFASIAVPVIIAALIWLSDEVEEHKGAVPLLFLTGMFAGMCTSLGAFFAAVLILAGTFVLTLVKKNGKLLLAGIVSVIPEVLYIIAYTVLK